MIKRVFKFLIFASIVFSLLCFTAWAYLNSNYAKPQITETIGKSLSKFTGSNISLGDISFSFPGTLTLNDITLSEASTPWITAKRIYLSISPSEILQGKVVIKSLELDDVNLLNLPAYSPSETNSFSLNSLHLSTSLPLDLEEIKINHLILSPKVTSKLNLFPEGSSKELQFYTTVNPDLSKGSISIEMLFGQSNDAQESLSIIELSIHEIDNKITAAFDIRADKSSLISELIGRPLPDNLHLHGNASSSFEDLQALLEAIPNSIRKPSLNSSFSISLGEQVRGRGDISIFSDRSLHVTLNEAHYGFVDIRGNVLLSSQQTFDGTELNISLKDIALLEPWLAGINSVHGPLKADCFLSGSMDTAHALINFNIDEIIHETIGAKKIIGQLEVSHTIDQWQGKIHLSGSIEAIPLDFTTLYAWKPGKILILKDLSLVSDNLTAVGTLTYEQDSDWFEADIKGRSNLTFWNRWLPEPLDGDFSFVTRWQHSPSPSLELQIDVPALVYREIIFKEVILSTSLSNLFNFPMSVSQINHFQGKIFSSIGQIVNKDLILNNLNLATTINRQDQSWPFLFSIGDNSNDFVSLDTEGNWSLQENSLRLSIDHLNGKISDKILMLKQAVELNWNPSYFESTPLLLSWGDSLIKTSINYQASQLNSSFQFDNIPLQTLQISPTNLPAQGFISGWATINGPLDAPKASSEISFKDIKINEYDIAKAPPISGLFQINMDETGLKCVGNAKPIAHSPLHIETHLPITLSLYPLALKVDKTAPIMGKAQIAAEIQNILQLLSSDSINLSGPVNASISISGTLESPLINGTASVENGTFEIPEIGAELHNVSAYFESSGKEVILKKLSASDKSGGTLNGAGHLMVDTSDLFPYQIDFHIHNLALLDQDFAKGAFTGNLTFKGNTAGATVSGSAVADSITITIPEQTAALVNSVDVTYINQPENEKVINIEKKPSWPLTLDLNVSAPEKVTVRGKELTSEWKGNLAINGLTSNLIFSGNFKVVKGQYLFNGKDFDINQGTITLNGPLENKSTTTLYVIASKDLGKVKVEVIVKGPVTNPEISFRSNPPMPQREILSWILFNRGTSEISPFQGTQLTESITNLKSNNKGPDVLTKIRNSLGIDRIDISRDENNGNAVSIQVGKYISKNVFVSVNKSNVNRIAVEATLMPNIKLQAQVGDDSQGQMLLKWKHDY